MTQPTPTQPYPLYTALSLFTHDSTEDTLEPFAAMTAGLAQVNHEGALAPAVERLRGIVETVHDEAEMGSLLQRFHVHFTEPPEGNSWLRWAARLLEQYEHALANPDQIEEISWADRGLPRVSRFTDEDTADAAATEVVRANGEVLESWWDAPEGLPRLHLYADLARPVGEMISRPIVPGEYPSRDAAQQTSSEVSGCVVIFKRDKDDGHPYIWAAYPEGPLDVGLRAKYPDLPHLFGGYFGQDMAQDSGPWWARGKALAAIQPPARDRVRSQLDALLAGEPDLHTAVLQLGAYIVNPTVPGWVARLRASMDAFDWTGLEEYYFVD